MISRYVVLTLLVWSAVSLGVTAETSKEQVRVEGGDRWIEDPIASANAQPKDDIVDAAHETGELKKVQERKPRKRHARHNHGKQPHPNKHNKRNPLPMSSRHPQQQLVTDIYDDKFQEISASVGIGSGSASTHHKSPKQCPHGGRVPASRIEDGRRRSIYSYIQKKSSGNTNRRQHHGHGTTIHLHFGSMDGKKTSRHTSRHVSAAGRDVHIHVDTEQRRGHGRKLLEHEKMRTDAHGNYYNPNAAERSNQLCRDRCKPCGYTIHTAVNYAGFNDCDCNSAFRGAKPALLATFLLLSAMIMFQM
jgi:hypothetical protein